MARQKREQMDILDAIAAMEAEEAPRIVYSTSVLTQTNLPYVNPKPGVTVWARRNGNLHLIVTPGTEPDGEGGYRSIGFPYGTMPRLLLAWICREAVLTQSPVLELHDSLRAFMAELNLKDSGGKTGSRHRLRDQLKRLMSATLTVQYADDPNRDASAKIMVGRAMNVWWDGDHTTPDRARDGSTLTLSLDFYNEIIAHPVPLNMTALQILSGSAMRLDIYAWLTHRLFQLKHPTTIPWQALREHFGSTPSDDRRAAYEFKRDFTGHLSEVLAVYREARATATETGLRLEPSPPHVPIRGTHGMRRAGRIARNAVGRSPRARPAMPQPHVVDQ